MQNELLTVIVLEYKNGKLLYETLDSILNQEYLNIELLIAVDGDESFNEYAITQYIRNKSEKNISAYKVLNSKVNRGTVKNLNNAIRESSGSFIKIIAGDDVYPNSKVFSKQVNYLNCHDDCMLVVGNIAECDYSLNETEVIGFEPNDVTHLLNAPRERLLKYVCRKSPKILAVQSCCYRKSLFEQYGLFDERLFLIEDLPMLVRIVITNLPIGYINELSTKHRNDSGISTGKATFDAKKILYYEDLYRYFTIIMNPLSRIIGIAFVNMRTKMCRFRIDYSILLKKRKSKSTRLLLILKNTVPIMYYITTNLRGAVEHIFHKK